MPISLRDIDNRDEDDRPYEATLTVEQAVGYLDGPLRRDTAGRAHERIDVAIDALRAGDVDRAADNVAALGIRLRKVDR